MEEFKCPYCKEKFFSLMLATASDPDGGTITGQPVLACKCGKTVIPYMGEQHNHELMSALAKGHSSLDCA